MKSRFEVFKALTDQWWWFDEAKRRLYAGDRVAWQWELLRRSRAYRKELDQRNAYVAGKTSKSHVMIGPLGDADPSLRWHALFIANCTPNIDWSSLSEKSRNTARCNAPLFPRADVLAAFTVELAFEGVLVTKRGDGPEELESAHRDGFKFPFAEPDRKTTTNAAILGKYEGTHILEHGQFGAYVVVIFDVRLGRSAANQFADPVCNSRLRACLADVHNRLIQDLDGPQIDFRKIRALVLPSRQPYYAQAWIPIATYPEPEDVRTRFRTLLEMRPAWLHECLELWRISEAQAQGGTRPQAKSFEYRDFPPELKTKPARAVCNGPSFWAGFCAWDCKIERRFRTNDLLLQFLRRQIELSDFSPADLADALKRVKKLILGIDLSYVPEP